MAVVARGQKSVTRARPQPSAEQIEAKRITKAQRTVLGWFDEHARSFPWREHRDPYMTMVAEVMLQQTQTGRVAPSYTEFVRLFPSVDSLAHAPAMDVIRAWKGLGYNRRAVDLQRAARLIVDEHGGAVPAEPSVLRALPGIGPYSASAIACFAHDRQVPVIDVNVTRTLARSAIGVDPENASTQEIASVAERWLPTGDAYRWNQALMDVGAVLCRIDAPLCPACPLRTTCKYRASGMHRLPRPARPAKEPFEGSNRQKRGRIVEALRSSAHTGIALGALAAAIHPQGRDRDLEWLVDLLVPLEREGLVSLSPGARKGSARGVVRLPR